MSSARSDRLSSDVIGMIVSSVTRKGDQSLTELEAERLLNAIARAQSGVPTGVQISEQQER